jgi:hypothetical protein
MHSILTASLCCVLAIQAPEPGRDILPLLEDLYSSIESVECIYEGWLMFLVDPESGKKETKGIEQFQGRLLYTRNGNLRVDYYITNLLDGLITQRSYSSVNDQTTITSKRGNLPRRFVNRETQQGNVTMLELPYTMNRYFFVPIFRAYRKHGLHRLVFQKWENIDGHDCLVAVLEEDAAAGIPPSSFVTTFWIDMERGGHPIRVDNHDKQQLRSRTMIQLDAFEDSTGKRHYLPVSATEDSYLTLKGYSREPGARDQYKTVMESVVVNGPVGPERFRLGGARDQAHPGLAAIETKLTEQSIAVEPLFRMDRGSIEKRLNEAVRKAEEGNQVVRVSQPPPPGGWLEILRWAMIGIAILLLTGVIAMRVKERKQT